jgi:hypothetical protein
MERTERVQTCVSHRMLLTDGSCSTVDRSGGASHQCSPAGPADSSANIFHVKNCSCLDHHFSQSTTGDTGMQESVKGSTLRCKMNELKGSCAPALEPVYCYVLEQQPLRRGRGLCSSVSVDKIAFLRRWQRHSRPPVRNVAGMRLGFLGIK